MQDRMQGDADRASPKPGLDAVHFNISLANQYRLELIKYSMGIAAALFAFTVSFRPSLSVVDAPEAMWWGWAGLGASLVGGMFHLLGWDHYYKSFRDQDFHGGDGRSKRKVLNCWRRAAMAVQFGGFIVGVVAIAIFASRNIDNAHKAPPDGSESHSESAPTLPSGAKDLANADLALPQCVVRAG